MWHWPSAIDYPQSHPDCTSHPPQRNTLPTARSIHIAWQRRRRSACPGVSPCAFVLQKRVYVAGAARACRPALAQFAVGDDMLKLNILNISFPCTVHAHATRSFHAVMLTLDLSRTGGVCLFERDSGVGHIISAVLIRRLSSLLDDPERTQSDGCVFKVREAVFNRLLDSY
jgi:hypothetical protein